MALKAAAFIKVGENSALRANMINKIVPLENDLIPLPYFIDFRKPQFSTTISSKRQILQSTIFQVCRLCMILNPPISRLDFARPPSTSTTKDDLDLIPNYNQGAVPQRPKVQRRPSCTPNRYSVGDFSLLTSQVLPQVFHSHSHSDGGGEF